MSSLPVTQRDTQPSALIMATGLTSTILLLADAFRNRGYRAGIVTGDAVLEAGLGDLVIARPEVLATLDGVDVGIRHLPRVQHSTARLINTSVSLLSAHDKLVTAIALRAAGIPHPRSALVRERRVPESIEPPYVIKPRFGRSARDVSLCDSAAALRERIHVLESREWFQGLGVLVQEQVPHSNVDLRLIVAGGSVVGAIERTAAPGAWKTTDDPGGSLRRVDPPVEACLLAVRAVGAIGIDLAGVDLVLDEYDRSVVLDVNGAADFTHRYALNDNDIFATVVDNLLWSVGVEHQSRRLRALDRVVQSTTKGTCHVLAEAH